MLAAQLFVASLSYYSTAAPLLRTQLGAPPPSPRCSAASDPAAAAALSGRRRFVTRFAVLTTSSRFVAPAGAAGDAGEQRWVSGRSDPIRKTSKDSDAGTKKDPKYLSCLNDCVPRCLGPPGSQSKERTECIAECQDECCFTYQQCTYTIRS